MHVRKATLAFDPKLVVPPGLEDVDNLAKLPGHTSTSILSSPHNSIAIASIPHTSPKPSRPSRPSADSIQPAINISPRAHSALTTDA